MILNKYKPFIVAVTGSVGKTSTKDAVYDVLKRSADYVRKSEKSLNSEIGLPLTIIGVSNAWYDLIHWAKNILQGIKLIIFKNKYPKCLVLEVGADHPGDIKKIATWLRPDIAIMTRISRTPVHVEFFKSPEEVFEEKAALATAVKNGGTLVIFADDDKVLSLGDRVKDRNVSVVSYGIGTHADVRACDIKVSYESGSPVGFTFRAEGLDQPVSIDARGIVGETYVYPLLTAAAVGDAKSIKSSDIVKALNSFDFPKGRMNVLRGKNDAVLVDDSYNSSPDAVASALATLKTLECRGRKIAVLGDMMELGKYTAQEHRKVGSIVSTCADMLITVGPRSRMTAEEAVKTDMRFESVKAFDNSSDAAQYLDSIISAGDIVLVKGSQSMRMERVTKALLHESLKPEEVLVRQEKEWLNKK